MRYDSKLPSEDRLAIAYVVEILLRARETIVSVFDDTPSDLRDPARREVLRRQYKEMSIAIEQLRPPGA